MARPCERVGRIVRAAAGYRMTSPRSKGGKARRGASLTGRSCYALEAQTGGGHDMGNLGDELAKDLEEGFNLD